MYESFGLAQLEPLGCGAICVVSGVSGAKGFLDEICCRQGRSCEDHENIIVADYTKLEEPLAWGIQRLLDMTPEEQAAQEARVARQLAQTLYERLPSDDHERGRLLESGRRLAEEMSWDRVVTDLFINFINERF